MHSSSVLDRVSPGHGIDSINLLVLWRHPETRRFVPIGRFSRTESGFRFVYTRAAAGISGFRTLPGLRNLDQVYVSNDIPAVFAQRVMGSGRVDFSSYLLQLGLDPESAGPWEQIAASGGVREGDTLQFIDFPTVTDGRAKARFYINGIRHVAGSQLRFRGSTHTVTDRELDRALGRLEPGDRVSFELEEGNDEDGRATLVTSGGVPLGWVPRPLSASIALLRANSPLTASVFRNGGPDAPVHRRLVLNLDAAAPNGFKFDPDGEWEPNAT